MPDIFVDKKGPEEKTEEAPAAPPSSEPAVKTDTLQEPTGNLVKELGLKPHKKGAHFHLASSYCEIPPDVSFTNAVEGEVLLLFLRRHFITNVPWILKAIAMGFIPIILEILDSFSLISSEFVDPTGKIIVYSFYYFFILSGYVFVNYITWFYNISLVSNIRIIDIDFSQVIFENVAATKLSQVEDVNYSQIGVIRSVFDYGDVLVQTAGTSHNFEFLAVPHPEHVIKIIHNLIGRVKNHD